MHALKLKSAWVSRIQKGYPWVYTLALDIKSPPPAGLVYLVDKKRPFGIGYYNPLSKLACRVLTLDPKKTIDRDFFLAQFRAALHKREQRFDCPFYRLVHAEGDLLPGLIIDRFDSTLVCQTNTLGMEQLKPLWFPALLEILKPQRVLFRDDVNIRLKEGLPLEVSTPLGELDHQILAKEHGITFYASPQDGQKTGWFYDQRANRKWVSEQAKNKTVLDLYTYSGGFGISCAVKGANHVTLVDSSQHALNLAEQAAITNQVLPKCQFIKDNVFELLEKYQQEQKIFEVVIADPPAFVKEAKHKGAGLRGYQKLAKMVSSIVAPGGLLFIASCSHHASVTDFRHAVELGIQKANRKATFIRKGGADKDHPIHPLLPENHYLKALAYTLD